MTEERISLPAVASIPATPSQTFIIDCDATGIAVTLSSHRAEHLHFHNRWSCPLDRLAVNIRERVDPIRQHVRNSSKAEKPVSRLMLTPVKYI